MQINMKTNKNLISTWLLCLFLVALIITSIVTFLFQNNPDMQESFKHPTLFSNTDLVTVEKVVVKNQLGNFVLQRSKSSPKQWQLIEPRIFPANPQTLKDIYNALEKISILRTLKKDPINIAHYSLNKPFMEIEFYDKNNHKSFIHFGVINPIDNSTYIAHSAYNEIFQIKTLSYGIETLILSNFLDARVFHPLREEIKSLTLFRGPRKYNSTILNIQRNENQTWLINNRPASDNEINGYLENLLTLKAQMILDKTTPETQKFVDQYLSNPLYTIEISTGEESLVTYTISNVFDSIPEVKTEKKSSFIVKASNVDSPLIVQKEHLDSFSFKEKGTK